MNRDQLVRALRKYAKTHDLAFVVDTKRGKGSHCRVRIGEGVTTIQSHLKPGRTSEF